MVVAKNHEIDRTIWNIVNMNLNILENKLKAILPLLSLRYHIWIEYSRAEISSNTSWDYKYVSICKKILEFDLDIETQKLCTKY